jgi:hypothetical protein
LVLDLVDFDFLCPNNFSLNWIRFIWCSVNLSRSEWWKMNGMMADRWSSQKQDGWQAQHLCPLRLEGNHVGWRCSCHKEKGLSSGSH